MAWQSHSSSSGRHLAMCGTPMTGVEASLVHIHDMRALVTELTSVFSERDASRAALLLPALVRRISHKCDLIHQMVGQLERCRRVQRDIERTKLAIDCIDKRIVDFARDLVAKEHDLHAALTDQRLPRSIPATGASGYQSCRADEVTSFAKKLAVVSFSPAHYIERSAVNTCLPPAPLETTMALSALHLPPRDLLARYAIRRQQEQLGKSDALDSGDGMDNANAAGVDAHRVPMTDKVTFDESAVATNSLPLAKEQRGASTTQSFMKRPVGWRPGDELG